MKNLLLTLFSEKSEVSMMRVMSIISLIIAGVLAFKGMNESVSTFVYAAFGGKAVQKLIEVKDAASSKNN
jgi:Na+(H+)/acetate symporter ActP